MNSSSQFAIVAITLGCAYFGLRGLYTETPDATPDHKSESVAGEVLDLKPGVVQRQAARISYWSPVTPGDSLFQKDRVYVGPESSMRVKLIDQTELFVGSESLFKIKTVQQPYDTHEDKTSELSLDRGEVTVRHVSAANHRPFRVDLPNNHTLILRPGSVATISLRDRNLSLISHSTQEPIELISEIDTDRGQRIVQKLISTKMTQDILIRRIALSGSGRVQVSEPVPITLPYEAKISSLEEPKNALESTSSKIPEIAIGEVATKFLFRSQSSNGTSVVAPYLTVGSDVIDKLKEPTGVSKIAFIQTLEPSRLSTLSTQSEGSYQRSIASVSAGTSVENIEKDLIEPLAPAADLHFVFAGVVHPIKFRFKSVLQASDRVWLEFSHSHDFKSVVLRLRVSDAPSMEAPENQIDHDFSLSGYFLTHSDEIKNAVYRNEPLYWRLKRINAETMKEVTSPFRKIFLQKEIARIKEKPRTRKLGNSEEFQASLSWVIEGILPAYYRLTFATDSKFRSILCKTELPQNHTPKDLKEKMYGIDIGTTTSDVTYELNYNQPCRNSSRNLSSEAELFFKIELYDYSGRKIYKLPFSQSQLMGSIPR